MVPNEPVVNVKTGHVYERRLVTAHVAAHGTDPVSREPASIADFIELDVPDSKASSCCCLECNRYLKCIAERMGWLNARNFSTETSA